MARNALGKGLGALIRDPEIAAGATPATENPAASTPATSTLATGTQATGVTGGVPAGASQPGISGGGTPGGIGAGAGAAGTAMAQSAMAQAAGRSAAGTVSGGPMQVDIDLLDPSPFQPRTSFAEDAIEELAQSIRSSGIIQPLVVRRVGARFQLIAGERRWRAAQRAALLRVPVVLREATDEEALELTLVENIQREDLNPIDEARAFERLMEEFHLTQDEVATRTGKDRATVANAVRLLALDDTLLEWIEEGKLTAGHGRALLSVEDPKLRFELAQKASRGKLTVRQVEKSSTRRTRQMIRLGGDRDPNRQAALLDLERHIGTRVYLHMYSRKKPGSLVLEVYDEEQLQGLYQRLMR